MAIEIGSLTVKGSFCNMDDEDEKMKEMHEEVQDMRGRILSDVADMLRDYDRRRNGR